MAIADIDFEGTGNQGGNAQPVNNGTSEGNPAAQQDDVTALNGADVVDINSNDTTATQTGSQTTNQTTDDNANQQTTEDVDNNPSTGELNVGDSVEVDGIVYTVAENGNLVDDKGNVFKDAKDVAAWLKSVEVEDADNKGGITLSAIQEALGTTITDENGNTIEFTDDADGVKSYVASVIAIRSNELQQAAINRLYQDNPLLKQFQDYVQLTGTPRGFGDIPDRSGIRLDKDNEQQLVAVIKMAANEFGNKSLNDNYIKYLRDSGGLYDEAKNQLQALVDKDVAYRKDIETQAAQQRAQVEQENAAYWNKVKSVVDSRKIGNYTIPESFTKEVNGQKIVLTSKDFYDYLSVQREDENGNIQTGYQRSLANLSDDEYLNREILDAWLMFTGGTHKDLIDMAVKEEQVRQLRVKSKEQRSTKSVKVIKKPNAKTNINDIILS